tara:strand:- start:1724 stop:2449 length:726 start_codon:yes stop_codon:yes gene_type:complete
MAWFKTWFDSKYYKILYKNRNDKEATVLIDNILKKFQPSKKSFFLDLACGNGRHSIYLNKKGFYVDGVDLSKNSLSIAKKYTNQTLKFYLQDIRNFKRKNKYDYVLNLFTSFGYFEKENDNHKVFQNIQESLKEKGIFIIDFFNTKKVLLELKKYEIKKIGSIRFEIQKNHDKHFVYKEICITDKKNKHTFTEKVQLIDKNVFEQYAKKANMKLLATFGDYDLNKYNPKHSDRLLLVFQKT